MKTIFYIVGSKQASLCLCTGSGLRANREHIRWEKPPPFRTVFPICFLFVRWLLRPQSVFKHFSYTKIKKNIPTVCLDNTWVKGCVNFSRLYHNIRIYKEIRSLLMSSNVGRGIKPPTFGDIFLRD